MAKAYEIKNKKIIFLFALILFLHHEKIFAAEFEDYYINEYQEIEQETAPTDKVTLNADRVSFNDETGQAFAEGNAVLNYNDTQIMAERIEYDADSQKVQAMPLPGQQVLLKNGTRTVKGEMSQSVMTEEFFMFTEQNLMSFLGNLLKKEGL